MNGRNQKTAMTETVTPEASGRWIRTRALVLTRRRSLVALHALHALHGVRTHAHLLRHTFGDQMDCRLFLLQLSTRPSNIYISGLRAPRQGSFSKNSHRPARPERIPNQSSRALIVHQTCRAHSQRYRPRFLERDSHSIIQ